MDQSEDFETRSLRRIIGMQSCIYVKNDATGEIAHVFGYSKSTPGGPTELTVENAKEAFAHAAASLQVSVKNEEHLNKILALVTEIKGGHEYTGDWGKPGEV